MNKLLVLVLLFSMAFIGCTQQVVIEPAIQINTEVGVLISESDYPIYTSSFEEMFIGEIYNLNTNNISEPLQSYIKSLKLIECRIEHTNNVCEYRVFIKGYDEELKKWIYYKSFMIIT